VTEFAQLLEKFGIPYGVLLTAIIALWREYKHMQQKCDELHDRLEKRAPEPVPDKLLEQLVSTAARMEKMVEKALGKARPAERTVQSSESRVQNPESRTGG
jgi:hypothetical protein